MKIKNIIDFKITKADVITLAIALVNIVLVLALGIKEIPENSLLENLQLVVLFFGIGITLIFKNKIPKEYRPLWVVGALVLFLMVLREVSYGRVFFCKVEGADDLFYQWKECSPHGYLVNYLLYLYIAFIGLYAIVKKVFFQIWQVLTKVTHPFWTYVIAIIALVFQLLGEGRIDNTCVEETGELVMYLAIISMIYTYSKKLK